MIKTLKVMTILIGCVLPNVHAACNHENTAIPFSTPSSDFTVHGDGTVTHNLTGLMWMQCNIGQSWDGESCTGNSSALSWQNALVTAGNHHYAGHSDWRLPNKNELETIVELRCMDPAINTAIFPEAPKDWYWSSTPNAAVSNHAWAVGFSGAYVGRNSKASLFSVRLVRAG